MARSAHQPRQGYPVDMKNRLSMAAICLLTILSVPVWVTTTDASDITLTKQILQNPSFGQVEIKVPQGYQLEILNADLDYPRMMEFAPTGDLFIGSGLQVYRLEPPYTAQTQFLLLPSYPHSMAIRGKEMFIATTPMLYRLPYESKLERINSDALETVTRLPAGAGHSSRTVRLGPDGALYVSIGISGNCSNQLISNDYPFRNRRGGVFRVDESGPVPQLEPFASGLRNPVDFDWHPQTAVMYATNNGPDHLGFELPPEYFAKLTPGSFHGMPWFQFDGERIVRDDCIQAEPPQSKDAVERPVATFPARNAPLGMTFIPAGAMDERFEKSAVVALHGSWATQPDGAFLGSGATRRPPAVVLVRFVDGQAVGVEPLITGFQNKQGKRWARPAGVEIGPDGWLYITSDGGLFEGLMRLRKTTH